VRQWIEQQVSGVLDLSDAAAAVPEPPHLTACSEAQAAGVLNRIRNLPSAAGVFLELGCPGNSCGEPSIMASRLVDIQRRAKLETISKLLDCLDLINQAFAEVCDEPGARFSDFDDQSHCLIPAITQRSIATLCEKMIVARGAEFERAA
jgi:hypothetical protein